MTLGPLMIDVAGLELSGVDRDRLRHPLVGGVILFSRNFSDPEQVRALAAEIHAVRTPPLLVAVDQEGGRVQRFRSGFYELPPAGWLGHQYALDEERGRRLARTAGWLMAAELLAAGVDFSFAPVVDLDYGVSGVIGDRAFHSDPEAVTGLALAWMQGMRRAGMAAVAKHFPGHGHVVADSHHELPVDTRPYEGLLDDLVPYEHLIEQGLAGVMMAHVRYPEVCPDIASLSPWWIREELRRRLAFRGVVFSDDLSMLALAAEGDMTERVRRSLGAGADMALVCNDAAAVDAVLDGLRTNVDAAVAARLVTMRPARPGSGAVPAASDAERREAVAALDAARERPPLSLNG